MNVIPLVTAILSLLAAFFPDKAKVVLLSQHSGEVAQIVGFVGGLISAGFLWISHPSPTARAKFDVAKSFFKTSFHRHFRIVEIPAVVVAEPSFSEHGLGGPPAAPVSVVPVDPVAPTSPPAGPTS